jgi:hypothetical protein
MEDAAAMQVTFFISLIIGLSLFCCHKNLRIIPFYVRLTFVEWSYYLNFNCMILCIRTGEDPEHADDNDDGGSDQE